ncbi:outer membrane protein assembly factor BamB family protein [Candidatus Uabimicrobium amorphum]|uniref:Pyrrolo-quinoline quinone repeat domain-containing protein n=1 Tax=Uabimicrobium amorphum TaxID=2596890 RepID=A0A5S9ISE0_UABAM|nr:PQQ-binding-like beta-propeller repeat protein [Candidatus Uabimicrobium amorphum]BBM87044.1 hypothetical protein UABAM_05446 [Candidatus Uabimicrobium amorphum]
MRALCLCILLVSIHAQTSWPGFRGNGNSSTAAKDLPTNWSQSKGIAWKHEISGYGQSSPVVFNDKVFVTSSVGEMKETLCVYCFNLSTGELLWKKTFASSHQHKRSKMVAQSAPTPVVDEKAIYAFFESGDLIALNFKGEALWKRNLTKEYGEYKGNHGIGSSLGQTQKSIIVLVEHEGPSYLLSIDKSNGKNLWKNERSPRVSWASPLVLQDKIIISSNGVVEVYNAQDGKRLWFMDGIKKNTVPSPSCTDDVVVIGSSAKNWCMAIKRGKDPKVLWKASVACSFSSPLIADDCVYFVNRAGVLYCVDLKNGEKLWSERLPGSMWASAVNAGKYIYFFCKDGATVVLQKDRSKFNKVAENVVEVKGTSVYGVAATDGYFLIRSGREIIAIHTQS